MPGTHESFVRDCGRCVYFYRRLTRQMCADTGEVRRRRAYGCRARSAPAVYGGSGRSRPPGPAANRLLESQVRVNTIISNEGFKSRLCVCCCNAHLLAMRRQALEVLLNYKYYLGYTMQGYDAMFSHQDIGCDCTLQEEALG